MEEVIHIGIVDDNMKLARQLSQKLGMLAGIDVYFVCTSGREGLEWMQKNNVHPDIILMDIAMPGMDGIETTFRIKQQFPGQKILMLTVFEDEENIFRALQAGASGYLLKDEKLDRMLMAFHDVIEGGAPMSIAVASKTLQMLLGGYKTDKRIIVQDKNEEKLSAREKEILELLAKGLHNYEVAGRLFISEATVKKHIENIYYKLQVHSRVELVNWYNQSVI